MRDIPPALAAHLAAGATTLATCWRLIRRDGVVMGFTDHDRDLAFEATVFLARTGFDGTEAASELGLAVAGSEVAGALCADGITEADLEAGLYDAATVETWLVNWSDPTQRLLVGRAGIGEVRRQDRSFSAELRSLAHRLNQVGGRVYARACDADLGDHRCRVDVSSAANRGEAAVASTDGRFEIRSAGLSGFATGLFTGGVVRFTGGANRGRAIEVKRHDLAGGLARVELWRPAAEPIEPGDAFEITAGCDKSFETCRDRFANASNFRGFPQIPGNDRALGFARPGERHDGGSLRR
jgi:uncharacterized phage protein (TIGR02218 family)